MNHIYVMMGKSASGKDSIFQDLLEDRDLNLMQVVPYTTRPIRKGEEEGREYHFTDIPTFEDLNQKGQVIEHRVYHTVLGDWYYFTVDDGQIDLSGHSVLVIGTLDSYLSFVRFFGQDKVIPLYVEVEDGERLERALRRERKQKEPHYAEMCRRFLADSQDFSEENLSHAQITRRFVNVDRKACTKEIASYIEEQDK